MTSAKFQALHGTPKKKPPSKSKASSLTEAVLTLLALRGWKAWRNNTIGVWDAAKGVFRKNPKQLKGTSDVLAFNKKTGQIAAIEVKVGRDKLSPEQRQFLEDVRRAGGFACEARSIEQVELELNEFEVTFKELKK